MLWNSFNCEEFIFEEHYARIIIPEKRTEKSILILKTEYADAFPETEIELLKKAVM